MNIYKVWWRIVGQHGYTMTSVFIPATTKVEAMQIAIIGENYILHDLGAEFIKTLGAPLDENLEIIKKYKKYGCKISVNED